MDGFVAGWPVPGRPRLMVGLEWRSLSWRRTGASEPPTRALRWVPEVAGARTGESSGGRRRSAWQDFRCRYLFRPGAREELVSSSDTYAESGMIKDVIMRGDSRWGPHQARNPHPGAAVGSPCVAVADDGGEEVQEALRRLVAGPSDQRRHHTRGSDRAAARPARSGKGVAPSPLRCYGCCGWDTCDLEFRPGDLGHSSVSPRRATCGDTHRLAA